MLEIYSVPNPRADRSYWAVLDTQRPLPCRSVHGLGEGHVSITLRYRPVDQCIETRSFGRYLTQRLRESDLDQELLDHLVSDVIACCHPTAVSVEAHFESPEGISLSLSAAHPAQLP
jgi:hypothetical protein